MAYYFNAINQAGALDCSSAVSDVRVDGPAFTAEGSHNYYLYTGRTPINCAGIRWRCVFP